MLLHISEHSAETLQEQIIGQIRARILSGDLPANFALPSIRGLARELRVSVITVQRAYDQLFNEEIIYARRGKGFFVAALEPTDKSALARQRFSGQLIDLVERARRDGLTDKDIEKTFAASLRTGDDDDNAKD